MKILFYGGKLQAMLNHKILSDQGHVIPFVFDADKSVKPQWPCRVFHDEEELESLAYQCEGFVVCVGNEHRGKVRVEIGNRLEGLGLTPVSAIHPTTFIGKNVKIGKGMQSFARSGINDGTTIGDYCLIGMNAAVDHSCRIGDGVTIMNSSAILGESQIDDYAAVLPNATVMAHARISEGTIVGPGVIVHPFEDPRY